MPGVPPFAADFLLDTTRAAYLLVRNGIRTRYPKIRFILSHAGGFVPYASHRMAVAITADTGRSWADVLDDFASFYFDTALSSSAAALPSLLAFAKPGHITFGSDYPYAPVAAGKLFAAGLETYPAIDAKHPRRYRAHQRFGAVPPARCSAATYSAVTGSTTPPHREPIRPPRRRPPDEHEVAGFTPGPAHPTARWLIPSG